MTDLNTRMPSGSDVAQRTVTKPAFSDDLLEAVLTKANLQQAWKQVRANKGAAGVDGMTIDDFPDWVKAGHWTVVERSIRSGDYQPAPVRRVEIAKPDGGKRELGIPTVIDRVIQQAMAQILMPIFDPGFSTDSYGFRPGRNAHQAVLRVQSILKEGRRFAVDVDLSTFFDRVNHDLLMTHLGYKVRDKRLLGLIARYLRAGMIDNQLYLENWEGVPQGGPLSPLLANIMLARSTG
ncbi:reverse transcriptase domain-containing protein [Halomonadaceae bacterium KBTZ08]